MAVCQPRSGLYEACLLDLDDVLWELGRFGKLNVRHGKGSRRRGPKPRLVPLINGADRTCAGSSTTCGASSTPTTPGLERRCSRLSVSAMLVSGDPCLRRD